MNKIALIGPSIKDYTEKIDEDLNAGRQKTRDEEGKKLAWGWTYTLKKSVQAELEKTDFLIFAHNSENHGGDGYVTKCYNVYDFYYRSKLDFAPNDAYIIPGTRVDFRGVFYIDGYGVLKRPTVWEKFRDYYTEEYIKPINETCVMLPNCPWIPVIDEFEIDWVVKKFQKLL
jgi:hypothetical protein